MSSTSDLEVIHEWVTKAEEDYTGALDLHRRRKSPLPNLVCFHAQQCAEKYLKAYLIGQHIDFPRIHDLVSLLDRCVERDPACEAMRESCILLDPFSVMFRYPGHEATPEDATAAVTAVRSLRRFVRFRLVLPPQQRIPGH